MVSKLVIFALTKVAGTSVLETCASTKPLLSVGEHLRLFPGAARPQPRGAGVIHGPQQSPQHRGRAAHGVRLPWGCFHVARMGLDPTVPTTALSSTDRHHTVVVEGRMHTRGILFKDAADVPLTSDFHVMCQPGNLISLFLFRFGFSTLFIN